METERDTGLEPAHSNSNPEISPRDIPVVPVPLSTLSPKIGPDSGVNSNTNNSPRSTSPGGSLDTSVESLMGEDPPEPKDRLEFTAFFGLGVRRIPKLEDTTKDDKVFWVKAKVQGHSSWLFADTGSYVNIVDKAYYFKLPFHPQPAPPNANERLLSGHNTALPVVGEVILPFYFGNRYFYHTFKVVENFPVDLCLGADFFRPHYCALRYTPEGNILETGKLSCPSCDRGLSRFISSNTKGIPIALRRADIKKHKVQDSLPNRKSPLLCVKKGQKSTP